jgi:L-threonylcarbamoyladenylate synthase
VSRTTRLLEVDRNAPDPSALAEAAAILRQGGLVAFATETVYGLGADATNPKAVARIFEAKARPSFNPLIVHADSITMARGCVADWPDQAETLALRFWPGPLTLVLPRSDQIPDLVTAGRKTVGVRVPDSRVALGVIEHAGRPVAAPSANRSTGISPTLASHVLHDLDGAIDLILDSGQTNVGLESTVVDLTVYPPKILRPGPITAANLEDVLGVPRVHEAEWLATESGPLLSPGQMATHYAPRTPAVRVDEPGALVRVPWTDRSALIVFGTPILPPLPAALTHRFLLTTPEIAAQGLYVVLHQCDALGADLIVVVPPLDLPEWRAVRDRLWRATRPFRG